MKKLLCLCVVLVNAGTWAVEGDDVRDIENDETNTAKKVHWIKIKDKAHKLWDEILDSISAMKQQVKLSIADNRKGYISTDFEKYTDELRQQSEELRASLTKFITTLDELPSAESERKIETYKKSINHLDSLLALIKDQNVETLKQAEMFISKIVFDIKNIQIALTNDSLVEKEFKKFEDVYAHITQAIENYKTELYDKYKIPQKD